MTDIERYGAEAKAAAYQLALASTQTKNQALEAVALALRDHQSQWLAANQMDLAAARASGMSSALLDRLALTPERIAEVVEGVHQVAVLPDPVGVVDRTITRPNGVVIQRRRVPFGVVGIIYEARPNVTADAAALCLKTGNACILRGGKEALHSNMAAVEIMRQAIVSAGLPPACVSLIQDPSRESAQQLMHLDQYLDVLIPRGGAGLIRTVSKNASVPVIRTGEGVCHIYIDRQADLDMGTAVLVNAKCSRPSVCNAVECVLLHREIAADFLQKAEPLLAPYDVELRCDEDSLLLAENLGLRVLPAQESDWAAEYGDYILAVRLVDSTEEAVEFINRYGTGHSECIITENEDTAGYFLSAVDAAAVYHNASTRFTDGGEFGLGAEIGISTQKLHARGPMGLEELTSYKYVVTGTGQIRE